MSQVNVGSTRRRGYGKFVRSSVALKASRMTRTWQMGSMDGAGGCRRRINGVLDFIDRVESQI